MNYYRVLNLILLLFKKQSNVPKKKKKNERKTQAQRKGRVTNLKNPTTEKDSNPI